MVLLWEKVLPQWWKFHKRVLEAKQAGADFIKIMTTGILDFNEHGAITGTPLDGSEVKEMVHIAHEEGMAVMSHTKWNLRCAGSSGGWRGQSGAWELYE